MLPVIKGTWRYSPQFDIVTVSPRGVIRGSETVCSELSDDMRSKEQDAANIAIHTFAGEMYELLAMATDPAVRAWDLRNLSQELHKKVVDLAEEVGTM